MSGFGSLGGSTSLQVPASQVGGLEPYDPAKEYSSVNPDYVEHGDKIWEYINPSPATGITPVEGTYWTEVSAERFAHIQNTDTGTDQDTWQIGSDGTPGTKRTLEPKGSDPDIGLSLKPKGNGPIEIDGLFYVVNGEKILVLNSQKRLVAAYEVAEEFVAVPPTLNSPGIPGQKAYQAPYLYYCVADATWIRFLAEGSELGIMEVYTAVPPLPNSSGEQGQRAYDPVTSLLYECVANNTWIRYPITKSWT